MPALLDLWRADAPDGADALRARSREALEGGLPSKRVESWRFTPVKGLVDVSFDEVPATVRVEAPSGVSVERVASHAQVGTVAPVEHFAGLNAARFSEVLVIRATGASDEPVVITYEAPGEGQVAHPRVLVIAERTSELRLIERAAPGAGFVNAVTEVVLADGAHVDHVRLHLGLDRHVGMLAVQQGRDSHYTARVFSFGGALVRLDLRASLQGPGATCRAEGAYHVTDGECVDVHAVLDHVGPQNTSHQFFRGVLDGKGRAIFDGQSLVKRTAPGSEAHQSNGNLLLSDRATIHTKPHLEIDHDDVVASHGATSGALDEDAIFYLRSRGIPEAQARAMLTDAFLRAVIEGVRQDEVREELDAELARRGLSQSHWG